MQAALHKWGNSLGARIPARYAAQLHLKDNSPIDICLKDGAIVITPAKRKRYTLEELVNSITPDNRHDEVDTGAAVGEEFS